MDTYQQLERLERMLLWSLSERPQLYFILRQAFVTRLQRDLPGDLVLGDCNAMADRLSALFNQYGFDEPDADSIDYWYAVARSGGLQRAHAECGLAQRHYQSIRASVMWSVCESRGLVLEHPVAVYLERVLHFIWYIYATNRQLGRRLHGGTHAR